VLSRGYNRTNDTELFYCEYILEFVINFGVLLEYELNL
jgi:hypothetical protein